MASHPTTSVASVLSEFSHIHPIAIIPLGDAGGFSGAALWKVNAGPESWCLKAWPENGMAPERLAAIHRWMIQARTAGLSFVPAVAQTTSGATFIESSRRLWDLTEWMPGTADFHARPSRARIESACFALARLHTIWRNGDRDIAEPPSVQRRLRAATEWSGLVASGWSPQFASSALDPVTDFARSAWLALPRLIATIRPMLSRWAGRTFSLHPCLCDIWHDHVLFTGDDVTGIIDYGSMRLDRPAADLARLLGDLAGSDESLYEAGLSAYHQRIPLSTDDRALVRALDRTGTILAAANWLSRLYRDQQQFDNRSRVAARLQRIVARLPDPGDLAGGGLC